MNKFFETDNIFPANRYYLELRDWLLPMFMIGQVQMSSSDAGDVDGVLGMVAESGVKYGKE